MLSMRPWVGVWLCEAMDPGQGGYPGASQRSLGFTEARDNRLSVLDIPDAAVCRRRAENKVGAPWGARPASRPKGGGRGKGVAGLVPQG